MKNKTSKAAALKDYSLKGTEKVVLQEIGEGKSTCKEE